MNKIVRLSGALALALVLAGCAGFRVNMALNYGPHNPAAPAPSGLATKWVDVEHWQIFLVSKGFLTAGKFQLNTFDAETRTATKKFQATPGKTAAYELPDSGCVNFATYHKALAEGMPQYKPIRTPDSCFAAPKHGRHGKYQKSGAEERTATGDTFHDNTMHLNCSGADVRDWQVLLKACGYLPSSFVVTGTFDNLKTSSATSRFQTAFASYGLTANGKVDENTYAFVTGDAYKNLAGPSLVSQDGVTPTVESQTACGN